jgi:hypothetical protein
MDQVTQLLQGLPLWARYLGLGLLTALIARKSQVDAWAEMNPRLAGVLKILRGVSLDPLIIRQGLSLIFLGRLPAKPEVKKVTPPTLWLLVLALAACSSGNRSTEIKTAIDGARAACLIYNATRNQLPKPIPEADELCPLLQARDAVPPEGPAAVASGGAGE